MSLFVLILVLCAAFLHAGWNGLVKTGDNKHTGMLMLTLGHACVGLLIIPFAPFPTGVTWGWILASGLIHMFYQLFLGFAYERGDLSRVYPIARGVAPMLVLLISLGFSIDALDRWSLIGILVLGLGILGMAQGVFTNGEDRKLIPFALGSACATAGYSIVDGLGARSMDHAVGYVAWLLLASALFYTPAILALRGRSVLPKTFRSVKIGGVAAVASFVAYAIVVWAMTIAPIALVTALRETSILFAVLIGWIVFGERMTMGKAIAGFLIVAGVVLTRL